jgi:chorismate mutase
MGYESLLEKANELGLIVKEANLKTKDGLCKGNRIAIDKKINTDAEKRCILAEEIGHYKTTTGNIIDQSKIINRKQELKARREGYKLLIEPIDLVYAFRKGCKNKYEIAEYLNITEKVLEEIITDFKKQYGEGKKFDKYYIIFEPNLGFCEIFDNKYIF